MAGVGPLIVYEYKWLSATGGIPRDVTRFCATHGSYNTLKCPQPGHYTPPAPANLTGLDDNEKWGVRD